MSEENKEGKVLIEETDSGRHRRENPEPESKPKKKRVSGWLIATAAVVIVGIIAGLAVYFVQQKQKNEEFERMLSVTTDKVTLKTTTEEDFEIEDSDDIVIAEDDRELLPVRRCPISEFLTKNFGVDSSFDKFPFYVNEVFSCAVKLRLVDRLDYIGLRVCKVDESVKTVCEQMLMSTYKVSHSVVYVRVHNCDACSQTVVPGVVWEMAHQSSVLGNFLGHSVHSENNQMDAFVRIFADWFSVQWRHIAVLCQ